MTQRWLLSVLTVCTAAAWASAEAPLSRPLTAQETEFFEKRVRPVLVEHCGRCHGAKKQMGGLRLDSAGGDPQGRR